MALLWFPGSGCLFTSSVRVESPSGRESAITNMEMSPRIKRGGGGFCGKLARCQKMGKRTWEGANVHGGDLAWCQVM